MSDTPKVREGHGCRETPHSPGSNPTLRETECLPPRLCRDSPISPNPDITGQDGGESTGGQALCLGGTPQGLSPGGGGDSQGLPHQSGPPTDGRGDPPLLAPLDDDEEEVEEGRPAHTRKPPSGMTPSEMRTHALTHIPFHPGCRSCVAGRKRDHQHPRRSGLQ